MPLHDWVEGSCKLSRMARFAESYSWDAQYTNELKNFYDGGDAGEIWFGEDAEDDILSWVEEHLADSEFNSVLDIGTGNAHLLVALRQAGLVSTKVMAGLDYVDSAVHLAQAYVRANGLEDEIFIFQSDFIGAPLPEPYADMKFDFVLDKGTYDAICLSDETYPDGRTAAAIYPERVLDCLSDTGIFLITSCNWTEAELEKRFCTAGKQKCFPKAC